VSDNQSSEGSIFGVNAETAPLAPDELAMLKSRATMMGITFSNNIGLEALKKRVSDKMEGVPEVVEPEEEKLNPLAGDVAGEPPIEKMSLRDATRREAMKMIRVRITNMDPKKKDLHGEIFCVANRYISTVRKFIPYGEVTDGGYHIPQVLLDELESRKFVHIQVTKDRKTGQPTVKTSDAKEFAIEILPQLTLDELAKLAAAQLAASNA